MMGAESGRHVAFLLLIALPARGQPSTPVPAAAPSAGSAPTPPTTAAPAPAPAAPVNPAAAPAAPAPATPAAPPADADPAELASIAVQRGNELSRREEYAAAIVEYERAYELLPEYGVLYYIGAASAKLERWAAARRALAAYIELGVGAVPPIPPARVKEVRRYLEFLSKKTATLSLRLNVSDAEVLIDGKRVAPTEINGVVVEPGEHVVRVTKPGFRPVEEVLRTTNGEDLRVALPLTRISTLGPAAPIARGALSVTPWPVQPAPLAEPEPAPLWVPWTLTAVLAAGWLTTAALAVQARHDRDTIEQPGTPEHRIDAARRLHISLAVASDVLLAATLVSGGISAYLTWWPRDPEPSGAGPGPASIGGLGAGFSGQF
jgi:PEGA domain-containing protein